MISPPPSKVDLIKDDPKANYIWTKWFILLFNKIRKFFSNSTFTVENMTTAERDAMTAHNGMIIYNTTTSVFNFYEAGAWVLK